MAYCKLTKSSFMSGLQCSKKQWREINQPTKQKFTAAEIQRFETGRRVEDLARGQMAHGVLIHAKDIIDELNMTQHHIRQKTSVLFEAAFIHDEVLVKIDILKREQSGWTLIEVKSVSRIKEEYLYDAAIQYYCAKGIGVKITKVMIQHINNQCIFPDLDNLFTSVDVTDKVLSMQTEIKQAVKQQKAMLSLPEPNICIGKHCKKPYDCSYENDCWKNVPQPSIFSIPYLQWDKKESLIADGIYSIKDTIPPLIKLSDKQWSYVKMVRTGYPIIDRYSIRQKLSSLNYPLYFLDFETDAPAIPRFDGMRPYQKYPFQYSCHILGIDDALQHVEYLHIDRTDPRRIVAEKLLNDLGQRGSIIAYNAQFEVGVINALADFFPDLSERLHRLIPRFWDQLEIFKHHYSHPDFGGSNSIKSILPVIVESLSYAALDQVQDGIEAGAVWNNAIRDLDEKRRYATFTNLKAYCKLDTYAMVKIHKHLEKVGKQAATIISTAQRKL